MFGRKKDKAAAPPEEAQPERAEDADALMRQTLNTLDQSLAAKRECREKTARFVGSLRPLVAKAR